jgi:hypothetical protein
MCGDRHAGLPPAYGDMHAAPADTAAMPMCWLDKPLPGATAAVAEGDRLPIGTAACCTLPPWPAAADAATCV